MKCLRFPAPTQLFILCMSSRIVWNRIKSNGIESKRRGEACERRAREHTLRVCTTPYEVLH